MSLIHISSRLDIEEKPTHNLGFDKENDIANARMFLNRKKKPETKIRLSRNESALVRQVLNKIKTIIRLKQCEPHMFSVF